jgi:hypothetical protein
MAIFMGLQFNLRTKEHGREFGGVLCCKESTRQVYSGKVVEAPAKNPGNVPIIQSKCNACDKQVGDWHTHPPGFPSQRGTPGSHSWDWDGVQDAARRLNCDDYLGYMTNSEDQTTSLDKDGNEVIVNSQVRNGGSER